MGAVMQVSSIQDILPSKQRVLIATFAELSRDARRAGFSDLADWFVNVVVVQGLRDVEELISERSEIIAYAVGKHEAIADVYNTLHPQLASMEGVIVNERGDIFTGSCSGYYPIKYSSARTHYKSVSFYVGSNGRAPHTRHVSLYPNTLSITGVFGTLDWNKLLPHRWEFTPPQTLDTVKVGVTTKFTSYMYYVDDGRGIRLEHKINIQDTAAMRSLMGLPRA